MTAHLAHDGEVVPGDLLFDDAPDLADRCSGARDRHGPREGALSALAEPPRLGGHRRQRHCDRRISDKPVELRRDVDLHHVAGCQHARTRHTVHDLLVDADAREPWEAVTELRRRPRPMLSQECRADGVELRGGKSRPRLALHLAQRQRHQRADALEASEIRFR